MARTIAEIKESICADFMGNETVAEKYGFEVGSDFYKEFSKASSYNVLFYIWAAAAWVVENLFDLHKAEVNDRIEQILPHRPKWYVDTVLNFMKDKALIPDTDRYDTTGMSDADITAARVVKHAVAVEGDNSVLTIKVAGENGGSRGRLDDETQGQLLAYIKEVKDAGVPITLINEDADTFSCRLDIYYDPMMLPEDVEAACREAIEGYIENLPFNGEYTNAALVDRLQAVEGVKIPEMIGSPTSLAATAGATPTVINARYVPFAGYFVAGEITLNMRPQA